MNLLSIDFDYFFPMKDADPKLYSLYDWGHRDTGKLWIETLWHTRAAAFLANEMELPTTTGEEVGFWDQFKFSPTTKLFYADSHLRAVDTSVSKEIDFVVSYDAHHDGGYNTTIREILKNGYNCGSWMVKYHQAGAKLLVIYPEWKKTALDEAKPAIPHLKRTTQKNWTFPIFDRIFIARSGGWTPSWVDPQFNAFMEDCPVQTHVNLGMTPRVFDLKQAQDEADIMKELRQKHNESMRTVSNAAY